MSFIKSKGEKNFARCPHKKVTFRPRHYDSPDGASSQFLDQIKGVSYDFASMSASMVCPSAEGAVKTDCYDTSTDAPRTQQAALKNLSKVAGDLICQTCPFVDMSPAEVAQKRIDDAQAKIAALEAEARLAALQASIDKGTYRPSPVIYEPSRDTNE